MASINSLGIGSGLLTSDLAESIVSAERAGSDYILDNKETKVDASITAYGAVKSALSSLNSAASKLANESSITKTTASSSDESAFTATTNSTASTGSYTLNVSEIAKSHTLASKQYESVNDTVGTGTLTIKFGETSYDGAGDYDSFTQDATNSELSLELNSSNNTLAGIRDAINNAKKNVTATLVNDGEGYRLLLTSKETGASNTMEISVSGDSGLQSLAYNGSQFDENSNMKMTQQGQSAKLTVNGLDITSETNALNEVIKGVTINLTADTDGKDTLLNVQRDLDDITENVNEFVTSYNEYKDIYDQLTQFNSEEETAGILLGDSTLRGIQTQVKRTLTELTTGLSTSYQSLGDLGISTDQNDDFKLKFNANTFKEALQDDAEAVAGMMATSKTSTDSLISIISIGLESKEGTYDVEIDTPATQASVNGLSVEAFDFSSDVVIGGANDEFKIKLNGKTASVMLEQGSYSSGDDLALMLQNSINGASGLSGNSLSVVFNETDQRMEFTSSKFGSASNLSFSNLDPTVANTLGISSSGLGEVSGSFFNSLSDASFGATTHSASVAVSDTESFDFAENPASFDLIIAGSANAGTYSIDLNQDMSDVLNTDGEVTTDYSRDDMLSYINSELASQGLASAVVAGFNASDKLIFSTVAESGTQTLELTNLVLGGNDLLGLTDSVGVSTSGVSVPASTEFKLDYTNDGNNVVSNTITVAPGDYETGEELALAIESAINADANVLAAQAGAHTVKGSVSLANDIDFSSDPYGVDFQHNGTDYSLLVDTFDTDNLTSIQNELDSQLGAGVITASLESNGLVLTTNALGSSESIEILNDGKGASTDVGHAINAGIDFSSSVSNFSLIVDSHTIDITLDADVSGDADATMDYIQQQVNSALANFDGGGVFATGDILAKRDDSNQIYFETVSKNGVATAATFGAQSSIEVVASDANTVANLGISTGAANINGHNKFGMDLGLYQGFDSESSVTYSQNESGQGGFSIKFDNNTLVDIIDPSTAASSILGFAQTDSASVDEAVGTDVAGSINGVVASGSGQYLTARKGSESATNAYLLGDPAADFTSAVVIDGTNNTFKLKVDGVESDDIVLSNGTYASSDALIAEMEKQINLDAQFVENSITVDVQYDEDKSIFGIISASTGSDSEVKITSMTTETSDILGMSSATSGVKGKESVGDDDPATGIVIKVQGSMTGSRGSINYTEGIFKELSSLFSNLLDSDGLIESKLFALDNQKEDITVAREDLETRMTAFQARLSAQFLYNDKIISSLNLTADFLSAQFEAMNSSDS